MLENYFLNSPHTPIIETVFFFSIIYYNLYNNAG